jgi:hypothetical protein
MPTFVTMSNLEWRNPEHTVFDAMVKFEEFDVPIPYTSVVNTTDALSMEIFELGLSGDYGTFKPFTPQTPEELRASMPSITPRQLRLTLVRSGHSLASVTQAIAALPEGLAKEETAIEFEYATTFERTSLALLTIASALGMTPEAVDVMWSQAVAA